MATIMTKQGQLDNVITYEHICDTVADMANINPSYITLGSVCIVIKGENDDLEVYMADSKKEWKIVSSSSGEGSISSSGIHICAQDEYDSVTGMPTIEDPLSNTFYLTPGGSETNDLYNEWIWLEDDEEWEKFGSAAAAVSQSDWSQSDSSADDFIKNKPAIRQQANDGGILENGALSARGTDSHAEGAGTTASGDYSHAEGAGTFANGYSSHAEGASTTASGYSAHAEGGGTTASGQTAHAEGSGTSALGDHSHAEGGGTKATGDYSHTEGASTKATSSCSHAEGGSTEATGIYSHTEGTGTKAIGTGAHAEGQGGTASGSSSHAEGDSTTASGGGSHSEGGGTTASGSHSHAEGGGTVASGDYSHAEGTHTTANHLAQHVFGTHNIPDSSTASSSAIGNYVEIVGNGFDISHRSNARTLDWNGNEEVAGDVRANACGGANPISLVGIANNMIAIQTEQPTASETKLWISDTTQTPVQVPTVQEMNSAIENAAIDVQVDGVSVVANGVANVPQASSNNLGVVKVNMSYGIGILEDGTIGMVASSNSTLKQGISNSTGITPGRQHTAVFYGLAKAAGHDEASSTESVGTYTPEAKAAIKDMLGITEGMNIVTVSGTAPTINAASNTQYLCGEVLSLNFTPSATGICDVIFTSGSTQTVLTIPATVKMPEWFEVEANKVYEISITNGIYGAVMVWENA